jgi:hypothetical protein
MNFCWVRCSFSQSEHAVEWLLCGDENSWTDFANRPRTELRYSPLSSNQYDNLDFRNVPSNSVALVSAFTLQPFAIVRHLETDLVKSISPNDPSPSFNPANELPHL